VRLPASADVIELMGDLVVREGSSLRVVGVAGNPATRIVVGARQLRVDLGGKLELERVSVAHSDGGSKVWLRRSAALLWAVSAARSFRRGRTRR
jgi:hypothetical protein